MNKLTASCYLQCIWSWRGSWATDRGKRKRQGPYATMILSKVGLTRSWTVQYRLAAGEPCNYNLEFSLLLLPSAHRFSIATFQLDSWTTYIRRLKRLHIGVPNDLLGEIRPWDTPPIQRTG